MTTIEWIDNSLRTYGYLHTCKSYEQMLMDTGNHKCTPESFSRECRRRRLRMEQKKAPQAAHEVTTPTQAADFHKVDLGQFEVTGARVNTWGNAQNSNQQVRLELRQRKGALDLSRILEDFRKEARSAPPALHVTSPHLVGDRLLEISIPDLHLGLLSWSEETGADYNLPLAQEAYLTAVDRILSWGKAYALEEIMLVIGHDFMNSDSIGNTTTKGTPQDEAARWTETFSMGWKVARDAINKCLSVAPTRVVMVRGNHDTQRTYFMGEVLTAWFASNPTVQIDNSPKDYKAYRYGKCFIGHTHGHLCKHEKLPLIFANDFPELWGATEFRTARVGHGHADEVRSFPGMSVEMVPSLGAPSAWTASAGYRGPRAAHGYLWSRDYGNDLIFKTRPGR